MVFLSSCWCGTILEIVVALTAIFIIYYKQSFRYWKSRNVPFLTPTIPYGTLGSPFRRRETLGISIAKQYAEIKSKGFKLCGLYTMTRPVALATDLDYVKNILTKDFQHFTDRGIYYNEKSDPLSAHLFTVGGPKWRSLRTKLTPTFTSGKMKNMFGTLVQCVPNLEKVISEHAKSKEPVDIKDVSGCFTTDIIGSCAFGLDCNSFKDKNSPFRIYGKKVFATSPLRQFKRILTTAFPVISKQLGLKTIPSDISDFYLKVVSDAVNYRATNETKRKDFLQMLIELLNNKDLTLEEVAAQSFVFFLAGFETSSTTMTFALYELARDQEIQDTVRDEVTRVLAKHNNEITYEAIAEMKYLNQVIEETLRKYPPVPFVTRQCVKDYKPADQEYIIKKGITVFIPIMGIHYDPEYYPEPETFDPDRFTDENKSQRHHYTYLPFGEGPRICIGLRFGLMQTKVGLVSLLRSYRFSVNIKTQQPLKLNPKSVILAAEGDVWLDVKKL